MKIAVSAIGPTHNVLVKAGIGRASFFQKTDSDRQTENSLRSVETNEQ